MPADFEAPPTDLITLTRHILAQQQKLGAQASGDLTMLLVGIQVSVRVERVQREEARVVAWGRVWERM